jgi:signal transduction histidine kinase
LEAEQNPLRDRARVLMEQASMGEVANAALHNVGNVLNSANVSASLVVQRLRESRVQNMGKAVGLLQAHREDLVRFLQVDPKGRMLPAYLETLSDHLQTELSDVLGEMQALVRNLEHMKEIVAVQQSYASKCGVLETLRPVELVEDALRMNSGAFERHGVAIVREFSETPPITVDKHKVLQILVNLVRNAKYALDEQASPQKILTLQISAQGADTLAIRVRDNGIGIAADQLPRIFDHGFTTKPDGHGFGLHSGSIAASEMGGKLTVQSDGIGKGATFCLELPLSQTPTGHDLHARGHTNHFQR